MFKQRIYETIFTRNPIRKEHEDKFMGSLGDDVVFETLVRALLYSRMGDEDSICFRSFASRRLSGGIPTNNGDKKLRMSGMLDYFDDDARDMFYLVNVSTTDAYEFFENDFELFDGFKKVEKVTVFFQKNFKAACFCNAETRSTILFHLNPTIESNHYLGCATLAYFPWYFDPKKGITDLERRLIESLRNKTPEEFNFCMSEYAELLDIRGKMYAQLREFETTTEREMLSNYKVSLQSIDDRIHAYEMDIMSELKRRRETEIMYTALENKLASGESEGELMNYFKMNRRLVLEKVDADGIVFGVKACCEIYDEDNAEATINNERSFVYSRSIYSKEDTKRLFTAIFIDKTVQLNFCEAFKMMPSGAVTPLDHYSYGGEYKDCMPNPHIDLHGCLGNYRSEIDKSVRARNYIAVIELCTQSCRNLNWSDPTVMNAFVDALSGKGSRPANNIDCFVLPTGELTNVKGVIEYLKEENGDG